MEHLFCLLPTITFIFCLQPLTYMASRHFHLLCSVDVGEQAQAKSLRVGGVSKAIHRQRGLRGMKGLPYSIVQFIIRNGAPVRGINVRHGISIYNKANIFFLQYFYFNFSLPKQRKLRFLIFSFQRKK